ncbi:MAG: RIP metalloprotease RseP [Verrucomicrobia bacterium]|nr:RIP metalloprotease RseP [Verrucomicrobiota bacterium]
MSQVIFAFALLTFSIFIHELGHFLVARWRGLLVPRFSIFGIGKPIVSKKWRGVEFCVCWLPIGAYVMIPQLSDLGDFEGELPEDLPRLPPADYTSKVLVAVAGPAANIAFALLLGCIVWIVGVRIPVEFNRTEVGEVARELKNSDGKTVPGPAAAAGIQLGDVIRKIDDKPVTNYREVIEAIFFGTQSTPDGRRVVNITLERDGATLVKQVFPELTGMDGLRTIGIGPRTDLIVAEVAADTPAAKAGLLPGDQIIAVDGLALSRSGELREHFQKKNTELSTLTFKRGDATLKTSLSPRLETIEGRSIYLVGITWKFETILLHRTPLEQVGEALSQTYQTFASLLNRRSDIGVRHMSGIVGMVDNLGQATAAGLIPTLTFLFTINFSLAIFNLLPIPVLDGGHIAIATLTKLRGRSPSLKWMQNTVAACFLMLIGLIIYVTYHDILRAVQNHLDDARPSSAPAKPVEPRKKDGEKPAAPSIAPEPAPAK